MKSIDTQLPLQTTDYLLIILVHLYSSPVQPNSISSQTYTRFNPNTVNKLLLMGIYYCIICKIENKLTGLTRPNIHQAKLGT